MCDQQSLRSACAYAQSDQSLCLSLEYSMSVKLLTEQRLEFLSLKGSCTGASESILVKMPHCWISCVTAKNRNRSPTGMFVFLSAILFFINSVWQVLSNMLMSYTMRSAISVCTRCMEVINEGVCNIDFTKYSLMDTLHSDDHKNRNYS